MARVKNRIIANERAKRAEVANKHLLRKKELQLKEDAAYQARIDKNKEIQSREATAAQASSDRREIATQQDQERMRREEFKAEQARISKSNDIAAQLEKARLEARKEVELSHLGHSHRMIEKDKDLQTEITLRNGQYAFEIKKEKEQRTTKLAVQKAQNDHDLTVRREEQHHNKEMKILDHNHEIDMEELKQRHFIEQEEEKRHTYKHNAYVDIQVHKEKEKRETKEYKKRAKVDMEKSAGESINYAYRATVDAQLKVWVMEQELRIFGRKATDEEINNFVRNNRSKWESEIDD